jgi:hypothetical protein
MAPPAKIWSSAARAVASGNRTSARHSIEAAADRSRVERCSLYLVHSSPIAISEIVKTSNHAFSATLSPESTSQNGSGSIISSAVGVKLLPMLVADHGLTNLQTLNSREQTMTIRPP